MFKLKNKISLLSFSKSHLVEKIPNILFSKTSRQMSSQQLQIPNNAGLTSGLKAVVIWKSNLLQSAKREVRNCRKKTELLLRNVTKNSTVSNAECTTNSKVQPVWRCGIVTRNQDAIQLTTGELCLWDTNVHYFVNNSHILPAHILRTLLTKMNAHLFKLMPMERYSDIDIPIKHNSFWFNQCCTPCLLHYIF